MGSTRDIRLKVFLLDFPDLPAPSGYSKAFVERLFFATESPGSGPAPDNAPLEQSVHQFFYGVSDGLIRVKGEVLDWQTSSLNVVSIPHYNSATMQKPETDGPMVNYGESWPTMVAESLRLNGMSTDGVRDDLGIAVPSLFGDSVFRGAVTDKITRLSDGTKADKLVFLSADLIVGGAKRYISQAKTSLTTQSHEKVINRLMPDGRSRWISQWDENWSEIPELLFASLVVPQLANQPAQQADGTFNNTGPGPMVLSPYEVLLHELGHLLLDLPDMYGGDYAPWGEYELMHGIRSHAVQTLGSYTRNKLGWLKFKDRSREDLGFLIKPFETHSQAFRVTNGAPGSQHHLIISNREEIQVTANNWSAPVTRNGQGILAYRHDPFGRLRVSWAGNPKRKITSIVRVSGNGGESWKPGETIGDTPPANEIDRNPSTLRNPLGELWWTMDNIVDEGFGDLSVKLKLRALHLLDDYHKASWTGGDAGTTSLELDRFGGKDGHVMMVNQRLNIAGQGGGKALFLHPPWRSGGRLKGTYDVSSFGGAPYRLYAKVGMPDEATGSDGITLVFRNNAGSRSVNLRPGERKELIHDFSGNENQFEVEVNAGDRSTRDWVYLLDGWLVPLAPETYDFIQNLSSASWRSKVGSLTVGAGSDPSGEVRVFPGMSLLDGVPWGPACLFTHPNWTDDGFVEGTWTGVSIPTNGAYIRGVVGFQLGRRSPGKKVEITCSVVDSSGSETVLISSAPLKQYDDDATQNWAKNYPMLLELPVPRGLWGQTIAVKVRVNAADTSGQDWVCWPYLRLTTA